MAFKKSGTLDPHGGPILRTELLANSQAFTAGNCVESTAGTIQLHTAGNLIFGNIEGVVNSKGVAPTTNGNGGDFTMFFLTSSTNATVALMEAIVDISKTSLYSADPNATINTTYGSGKLGYHIDAATNGNLLSESSVLTTTAGYFIWGLDPLDSGNAIVNIFESAVFGV